MKTVAAILITVAAAFALTPAAQARGRSGGSHRSYSSSNYSYGSTRSHSVRGYTRRDGTYVQPSHATNRNSTKRDNWSTKGNINPYTGKRGTVDPNRR
jgi:hypothetical protein